MLKHNVWISLVYHFNQHLDFFLSRVQFTEANVNKPFFVCVCVCGISMLTVLSTCIFVFTLLTCHNRLKDKQDVIKVQTSGGLLKFDPQRITSIVKETS